MNYGFARSAGLSYWESLGYSLFGSFLWETFGETTRPSINDYVTTTVGGSFVGEAMFRMASLLLEGGGEKPGFWRELGAAVISPPTGFNRLVFEDRFKPVFPSRDPAVYIRLRLGATLSTDVNTGGLSHGVRRQEGSADFYMTYGLPGKPGYQYTRPFDFFLFEFTAVPNASTAADAIENVTIRGLLAGAKYELDDDYRGVWGLFGGDEDLSPQGFRVATPNPALGTGAQWGVTRTMALHGTAPPGTSPCRPSPCPTTSSATRDSAPSSGARARCRPAEATRPLPPLTRRRRRRRFGAGRYPMKPTVHVRILTVLSLATVLAIAVVAGVAAAQKRGGILRVGNLGEPPALDAHWTTASITETLTNHIYEGLYSLDSSARPIPMLAEGHTISKDGLNYTFKLRQGIKFHNGKDMTSDDVVASLTRWGKQSVYGKALFAQVAEFRAVDKYTVQMQLKEKSAIVLISLAVPNNFGAIYPKEIAEKFPPEQKVTEYVGTGPFKLAEWKPDQYIRMVRFDDYKSRNEAPNGYGGGKTAHVDEIRWVPVPEVATRGAQVG